MRLYKYYLDRLNNEIHDEFNCEKRHLPSVEVEYDRVWRFNESVAIVKKQTKYGFTNLDFKEIIPCEYDNVDRLNETVLKVKKGGKWAIVYPSGDFITPFMYDEINSTRESSFVKVKIHQKWGLITVDGTEVLPPLYSWIQEYSNEFAVVDLKGALLVINLSGEKLIEGEYTKIFPCGIPGLFCIQSDWRSYGLIDIDGNVVTQPQYDEEILFDEQLAAVVKQGRWGYIDELGNAVTQLKYDAVYSLDDRGYARVRENGKYGLINGEGIEIIPPQYNELVLWGNDYFGSKHNQFVLLRNEQQFRTSNISIDQYQEVKIRRFSELAIVSDGRNYGCINKALNEVISLSYENLEFTVFGVFLARRNGLYGVINMRNDILIPFEYQSVHLFKDLILVQKDSKYGYIDYENEIVVPIEYEGAVRENFRGSLAPVSKKNNNGKVKWGFINKCNEVVIPFTFDSTAVFMNDLCWVEENGTFFQIDRYGEMQGEELSHRNSIMKIVDKKRLST